MSRHSFAAAAAVCLIALAACGKVLTVTPADAPPRPDSAPDAAKRGMVSVTLLDSNGAGSGVIGAQVVFTDAEQTQRGVTDGSGVATAFMVDGGSVTTIGPGFTGADGALLQTVFGVKGGDQIVLGATSTPSNVLGSFTVNFTPASGQGSASIDYQVFGPCGSTSTVVPGTATTAAVTLNISSSCKLDPMELVVTGTNGATGASVGFVDKPGVSFVANGSTTITGAFQPLISVASMYTDAAQVTNVDLDRFAPDNFGFVSGASASLGSGGPGTATLTTTGPATANAVIQSELSRAGFGDNTVIDLVPGNATSYALDVGASVLTWLGPPTFDTTSNTIQVHTATDDAASDAPDLFFVEMEYERPAASAGGTIAELTWLAFSATASDMVMPALPDELASYLPQATDTIDTIDTGEFDSDAVSGYDQARLDPYALPDAATDVRGVTTRRRFAEASASGPITPGLATAASRARSSRSTFLRAAARAR